MYLHVWWCRYGCCLDGVTAAQGFKRAGCPEFNRVISIFSTLIILLCSIHYVIISFSRPTIVLRISPTPDLCSLCFQDYSSARLRSDNVCGLARDVGSCYEWTSRFFFDHSSGSCSQFWYGGCHGNDNNFVSKEECERTCKGAARVLAPREPTSRKGIKPIKVYKMKSRAHKF